MDAEVHHGWRKIIYPNDLGIIQNFRPFIKGESFSTTRYTSQFRVTPGPLVGATDDLPAFGFSLSLRLRGGKG